MMMDDDFKLLGGFALRQTDEQTFVIVESLSRLKINIWNFIYHSTSVDFVAGNSCWKLETFVFCERRQILCCRIFISGFSYKLWAVTGSEDKTKQAVSLFRSKFSFPFTIYSITTKIFLKLLAQRMQQLKKIKIDNVRKWHSS